MKIPPSPKRPELERLLKEAVERWKAMSPDEQEAMLRQQRDGYVRAEMSWRPKYEWKDGVKVYASYADYIA